MGKLKAQKEVTLAAPWVTYAKKIACLFGRDPEIKVEYNEETYTVRLYVANQTKAEAIAELLPDEKEFGNITLTIEVVPGNEELEEANIFEVAFEGNPIFKEVVCGGNPLTSQNNYVVFTKEVIQFFNDDLTDLNGNWSGLAQDIAKEVFGEEPGVFYCTDATPAE